MLKLQNESPKGQDSLVVKDSGSLRNPRRSMYTTIRELGPKIPYYTRNYGSQFPNGCICGPSGNGLTLSLVEIVALFGKTSDGPGFWWQKAGGGGLGGSNAVG